MLWRLTIVPILLMAFCYCLLEVNAVLKSQWQLVRPIAAAGIAFDLISAQKLLHTCGAGITSVILLLTIGSFNCYSYLRSARIVFL